MIELGASSGLEVLTDAKNPAQGIFVIFPPLAENAEMLLLPWLATNKCPAGSNAMAIGCSPASALEPAAPSFPSLPTEKALTFPLPEAGLVATYENRRLDQR